MLNILLSGIGGQGTVLAAKILAQAAQEKGWAVRTAETIGMAQRGGTVTSHVRMADKGEDVQSSLLVKGSADLIVAFEPGEAARALPFLSPKGTIVTASTPVQPVTASLSGTPYRAADVLGNLEKSLEGTPARLIVVNEAPILAQIGTTRALNTVLLAAALGTGCLPLTIDDLREAIRVCVKPRFVDLNLNAIDIALARR